MQSSYKKTKRGIVTAVTATAALMVVAVLTGVTAEQPSPSTGGTIEHPASLDSMIFGCGAYYVGNPQASQYAVLDPELADGTNVPAHEMTVPMYGYMTEEPLTEDEKRFYERGTSTDERPSKEQLLASMYRDNTTVFWYSDALNEENRIALIEYTEATPNSVAVQWDEGYGFGRSLPFNRAYAISTWGVTQTCEYFQPKVAEMFNEFATANRPASPEPRIVGNEDTPLQEIAFPLPVTVEMQLDEI